MKVDQIDEDHPLVLEILSLKAAVSRFQDEAHSASLKLQRFSFDASMAQDRVIKLERENALLKTELATLRANPHPDLSPTSHPAVLQSQELTLSLRRLSDKLSLTEQTLLERTTELTHIASELAKSNLTIEGAYALAARTRGREEDGKVRERALEMKIRELKEEVKMEDLVVKQYADLVRSLEGRNSSVNAEPTSLHNNSSATLVDGISEDKVGLQKLFSEFSAQFEPLQAEVEKLKGELAVSNMRIEAEKKGAEAGHKLLAAAQKELQMLKIEDRSAAAMVSRYMKFSQASTNMLQNSLNTLKVRHSATIDTLSNQIANITTQLQSSQATSDKLRTTLDELGKDIMRESYGRRREIALRLKFVVREEALQEALGRWIRKGKELLNQEHEHVSRQSLEKLLSDARAVYAVLDTPSASISPLPPVSDLEYSPYSAPTGSLARIIAIEASVNSLVEELHLQISRRQELELAVATESFPPVPAKDNAHSVNGLARPQRHSIVEDSDASALNSDVGPHKDRQHSEMVDAHEEFPSEIALEVIPSPSSDFNEIPDISTQEDQLITVTEVQSVALPDLSENIDSESTANYEFPANPHVPTTPPFLEQETSDISISSDFEQDTEKSVTGVIASQSLIAELNHVNHRYDDLQRAFRDCHLALQELRKTLSSTIVADDVSGTSIHTVNGISSQIYQAAIERLDDYNEDARVELEIRAADEALLAQGYQTMLSVSESHDLSNPSTGELEAQIRGFISGADLNVQRARQSLSRKLADVQNDIAVLKRAMHDPDAFRLPSPATTLIEDGTSNDPSGNSGWTAWIRGTSARPASPSPAQTFGHVMTNPRLKHSSSFHQDLAPTRRGSVTTSQQIHPFANLDLRVSMPALSSPLSSARSAVFSPPGLDWNGPRTRTVSAMNMLGLGTARSASTGTGGSSRPQASSGSEEEGKEDSDDDVE
ncbi:hypothetical protein EV368DRAFT_35906 [Lentinula lateritia]|nr:hypothetical protein EV368DRAFT_35906 [Lentinula lateritia]